MADPITLAITTAALTATSQLMGVAQQRAVAGAQAENLTEQARATALEAGAAEEAKRRETRRAMGETRAAGAEMGLLESGSFQDAYSQAATMAELDALNIRYSGETKRQGLLAEAKLTKASKPSWAQGLIGAGASALSSGIGTYGAAGGKFTKGKG